MYHSLHYPTPKDTIPWEPELAPANRSVKVLRGRGTHARKYLQSDYPAHQGGWAVVIDYDDAYTFLTVLATLFREYIINNAYQEEHRCLSTRTGSNTNTGTT